MDRPDDPSTRWRGVERPGIELWRLGLTMRVGLGTSSGVHRQRPVIYVRLVTDRGEGWGECPALAEGTAVDPCHEALWTALCDQAAPRLLREGGELPALTRETTALQRWSRAALEMALLDLECRTEGRSLGAKWGAQARVEAGAVLGIPLDRQLGTLLRRADELVVTGFPRLRVKIAPGWDVAPLRALRDRHPDLTMQADANAAYGWGRSDQSDAPRLAALDELGLRCLEQPLHPEDLAGHVRLGSLLETPICLDESLWSLERVEEAIDKGACRVACLKPSRLGGLTAARRAGQRCREAGVSAFVGGFFETGLGRAANAALAGLDGLDLPGDLSAPASYLDDPCGYPAVEDGWLRLDDQPGVGRPPAPDLLRRTASEALWVDGGDPTAGRSRWSGPA